VKIVLRQDVEHLGQKGDIVDVADGYARNFLVPRGLALRASAGVQKQADAMRRSRDARDSRAREAAQAIADQLAPTVRLEARAGEGGRLFGSVTTADIAAAVQAQLGVEVDRRDIALDEPLKELGEREIGVKLHRDVPATLRVEVVASSSSAEIPGPGLCDGGPRVAAA
jgi:large subunit ribosomal protein L9